MFNERQKKLTRAITADLWNNGARRWGRFRNNRTRLRESINAEIDSRAEEFGIGIPYLVWIFAKPFIIKAAKQLAWKLLMHYIEKKLFGGVKEGGAFQSDEPVEL